MVQNNLIEWFIVAFITFNHSDEVKIKLMQDGFATKPACVSYLKENASVVNDIQILEPTNNGMWFECLDTNTVARYKIKRKSI